jgi:hypothetical protein
MIDDNELEETTVSTQYPALESRSTVRAALIIFIDRQEAEANRSQVDEFDSDVLHVTPHHLADRHGLSLGLMSTSNILRTPTSYVGSCVGDFSDLVTLD